MNPLLSLNAMFKPTALYGIPLMRTSAGDHESNHSLMLRTALAHRVTPLRLREAVLVPKFAEMTGRQLDFSVMYRLGTSMLNASRVATDLCRLLEALTGMTDLRHGTMLPFAGCTSNQQLLSFQNRVCVACIREDLEMGREPYGRLLWKIECVTCCPVHCTNLTNVDTCPEPKRVSGWRAVKAFGVCSGCASVGYACSGPSQRAEQDEEDRARMCRDFIADGAHLEQLNVKLGKAKFKEAAKSLKGGYALVAERASIPKSLLARWLNDDSARLRLRTLLDVARVVGVTASQFVSGSYNTDALSLDRSVYRVRKKPRESSAESLQFALAEAVAKDDVTLPDLLGAQKFHRKQLRKANPAAYEQLKSRGRSHRQGLSIARWNASFDRARTIQLQMREKGQPYCTRTAAKLEGRFWTVRERHTQIFLALTGAGSICLEWSGAFPLCILERIEQCKQEDEAGAKMGRHVASTATSMDTGSS